MELKTGVDKKLFGKNATIIERLSGGQQYVYKIQYHDIQYIAKGYQILLEGLNITDDTSKDMLIEIFGEFNKIYDEYLLYKTAASLSPHFAKPLMIDYTIKLPADEASLAYLYVEIIFENPGNSLTKLGKITIEQAYNLMRQSSSALQLLRTIGATQIDIKPDNLFYNEKTDRKSVV